MTADLRELYQEVILDHNRNPRNFREIPEADRRGDGFNSLCGDRVTIYLKLDGGRIADISFNGSGCAISTASASMLTEVLKGKTVEEAREISRVFFALVTGDPARKPDLSQAGKLAAFAGVGEYPARVKCATLAWHTLLDALEDGKETVTTE